MKKSILWPLFLLLALSGCINTFSVKGVATVTQGESLALWDQNHELVHIEDGAFQAVVETSPHPTLTLTTADKVRHQFSLLNLQEGSASFDAEVDSEPSMVHLHGELITKQISQDIESFTVSCHSGPEPTACQYGMNPNCREVTGVKRVEEQVTTSERHHEMHFTQAGEPNHVLAVVVTPAYRTTDSLRLRDLTGCF